MSGTASGLEGWRHKAACKGAQAGLFFQPSQFERKHERLAREQAAKSICARCPVREQCLAFALAAREAHGVWGGLNEVERRKLRDRRAG